MIKAALLVLILGLLACAGGMEPMGGGQHPEGSLTEVLFDGPHETTLRMPATVQGYYEEAEARVHHCVDQAPPVPDGFWELAYTSVLREVGRFYQDRYEDADGNIVEGGYLDPANIVSVEVMSAAFGELRMGRRLLFLSLRLKLRPAGAGFFYYGAEGYMDENTCEITYFNPW